MYADTLSLVFILAYTSICPYQYLWLVLQTREMSNGVTAKHAPSFETPCHVDGATFATYT